MRRINTPFLLKIIAAFLSEKTSSRKLNPIFFTAECIISHRMRDDMGVGSCLNFTALITQLDRDVFCFEISLKPFMA